MNFNCDWLLSPITQYVLIAVGFISSFVLWITNARDLHSLRATTDTSRESIHATIKGLSDSVEQVRETVHQVNASIPPAPGAPRLTPASRAQALRLHQRGEAADRIAAALRLPRNQIELLVKLDRLMRCEN